MPDESVRFRGVGQRRSSVVGLRMAAVVAALVGGMSSADAQTLPCRYDVTVLPNMDCGILGTSPGAPVAINNLGHVLLTGTGCVGEYSDTWVWTGGNTLQLIPRSAGMLGFTGADLNDNGLICGTALMTYAGQRGFIYNLNNGQWTELPPLNPPTGWSGASAITNDGRVCGYRSIGSPNDPVNPKTAYWWSPSSGFHDFGMVNGRSTTARDMNNAGTVTVSSGLAIPGAYAYVWNGSVETMLAPRECIASDAGRVNQRNVMTVGGMVQWSPLVTKGFLWRDGSFQELLPLPKATGLSFGGLTDAGLVAGRSNYGSASNTLACVWSDGQVIDLNGMVPGFSGVLKYARSSGNGKMAVQGNATGIVGPVVFLLTPDMPLVGDADCDDMVNVTDLLGVISQWGSCMGCREDFDADGQVGVTDLLAVIANWG